MTNTDMKCSYCEEFITPKQTTKINGEIYCGDCVHDLFAMCNHTKQLSKQEFIDTCAYDDKTYHVDFMTEASDGSLVFNDNLDDYEERIDLSNDPQYDNKQAYDRFQGVAMKTNILLALLFAFILAVSMVGIFILEYFNIGQGSF